MIMQLDLEILPFFMGVAAVIFYRWRNIGVRRPRSRKAEDDVSTCHKLQAWESPDTEACDDEPSEPVAEPQPESEPELEPEEEDGVCEHANLVRCEDEKLDIAPNRASLRLMGLLPLAALIAAAFFAAVPIYGEEEPRANLAGNASLAEHGPIMLKEMAKPNEVVVSDSLPDFAEPALTIKLTRQSMNMYEDDEFVKSAYFGTLMVGTPPEPFTVVFDTGSGHLVLPSTYCSSDTCKAHKRFRRSASSSALDINNDGTLVPKGALRDQISVSFGTGEVTGVFVEDVICIDGMDSGGTGESSRDLEGPVNSTIYGSAALPLQQGCVTLRMIAATELSEDPFKTFEFDGILGLGLDGLSQTPEFNFLGVVAKSIEAWGGRMPHTFGVFLANHEAEDSEISLGGWARNHLLEDVSWSPVPDPELGHWVIDIKGIRVDGKPLKFCEEGCKAAVDTGTSLLAVPTDVFPELYGALKHPAPPAGHCQGSGPMLAFEFESFTVTLGPQDYAKAEPAKVSRKPRFGAKRDAYLQTSGGKPVRRDLKCSPILMTLDLPEPLGPKLFILGEPVLRKYYTVYDRRAKRVGFGRARHGRVTSREDYFMDAGMKARTRRKFPTMFDIFRWRKHSTFTSESA